MFKEKYIEKPQREIKEFVGEKNESQLLSEREQKIKNLEDLKIGSVQKAEIMLVLLGHKPSTELTLFKHNSAKEEVIKVLSGLGLNYVEKESWRSDDKIVANFAIAKNEEILERLLKSNANKDHEEFGRLMGFSESAIRAFMNKDLLLDKKDYPDMNGIIFPMMLSKENWEEEVELLGKWSDEIKKYSRKTYDSLVPKENK